MPDAQTNDKQQGLEAVIDSVIQLGEKQDEVSLVISNVSWASLATALFVRSSHYNKLDHSAGAEWSRSNLPFFPFTTHKLKRESV